MVLRTAIVSLGDSSWRRSLWIPIRLSGPVLARVVAEGLPGSRRITASCWTRSPRSRSWNRPERPGARPTHVDVALSSGAGRYAPPRTRRCGWDGSALGGDPRHRGERADRRSDVEEIIAFRPQTW